MTSLRWIGVIAWKDLRAEFRSGGRIAAMLSFSILACFLFSFSLDRSLVGGREVAAGLLWLTVLFASISGAGRTFDAEEEDGAFRHLLLSPVSRHAVFLGKAAANLVPVVLVAVFTLFALILFFGIRETGPVALHAAVLLPGTIGLAAAGTLFGLMSRHSNLGDSLLPALAFPVLVPLVFFGATASSRVFLDRPWVEIAGPARLLWAFAICLVAVGSVLFRYLTDD